MAVTELAWFTAAGDTLTAEGKEAANQAIVIQDEWCAQNLPTLPKDREGRGVAFFQQIEDPAICLLTSHWDSVEQHHTWINTPENRSVFPILGEHFALEKTTFFHVADTEFFKPSGVDGEVPILESPVVCVGRHTLEPNHPPEFDQAWTGIVGVLKEHIKPNIVKFGWRIEKEDQAVDELVYVAGFPSVESHKELGESEHTQKYASVVLSFTKTDETKHYKRIL
ncbi:hypothetical protein M426DRAFT_319213 [Hypoxylon sp. CI-4A]|nr:hypothetical protein M426DRAFT_319213 [Hypoxylon sp. CI-4A]